MDVADSCFSGRMLDLFRFRLVFLCDGILQLCRYCILIFEFGVQFPVSLQ